MDAMQQLHDDPCHAGARPRPTSHQDDEDHATTPPIATAAALAPLNRRLDDRVASLILLVLVLWWAPSDGSIPLPGSAARLFVVVGFLAAVVTLQQKTRGGRALAA